MTRKHFEAIAYLFRERKGYSKNPETMHRVLAEDMADYLATTNPSFDRARFLAACGVSK